MMSITRAYAFGIIIASVCWLASSLCFSNTTLLSVSVLIMGLVFWIASTSNKKEVRK